MSPTICAKCGAVLSLPTDRCQSCGYPLQETVDLPTLPPCPPGSDSLPEGLPATPPSYEEDAARVEKLLGQIAAQSHFEERYGLRGLLAQGGMGKIFSAYDRILRRHVAIKMTPYDSAGASLRGQFLKEARVGGRLLHPNILAVFDLGVNRSGQIYYTMRLVEGASLQQCCDSLGSGIATMLGAFPLRQTVEAVVKACHGVDYAHQNGVIHLDLKPQNILVSRFNEVFVIDWGLARVDDVDDTEELVDLYRDRSSGHNTASHTAAFGGRVVGTPGYMAPEQAGGDYRLFDAATDVFGMGGILYFVLYGKPPNQGKTMSEMLAASREPKKKGKLRPEIRLCVQRARKEVQEAIEALEAICLQALHPDKANRYADVEKMIVELNKWLSNTPHPPLGI